MTSNSPAARLPGWSIAVQPLAGDRARIEAVSRSGGLYCLISTDPAEIWRELRGQ